MLSVLLGAAGLAAVLCLWFPSVLTTPELREIYDVTLIRGLIKAGLLAAFLCGAASLLLKRRKALGLTGIGLAGLATLMGGSQIEVSTPVRASDHLGLDWFLLNLLILATVLPLASFGVLMFAGKRLGTPLAGWVATAAIGGSFLCSVLAMGSRVWQGRYKDAGAVWGMGVAPISKTMKWIPVGTAGPGLAGPSGVAQEHAGWLEVGVYVDSLTIAMFSMVTTIG